MKKSSNLSSSPPGRAIEPELDIGQASSADNPFEPTSPTLTLGHSSPELPPLPDLPAFGRPPGTPAFQAPPDTDSTYYTASWGSPYDEPRPNSISANISDGYRRSATASSDIDEEDSPNPRFGLSHLIPSRLPPVRGYPITPTRPSTPSPKSPPSSPPKFSYFATSARSLRQLLSPSKSGERPKPASFSSSEQNWASKNWWSQEEALEDQGPEVELQLSPRPHDIVSLDQKIEPFQLDGTADTAARTDRLRDKGHKSRDSNLTLTQEDFWPSFSLQEHTPKMFTQRYAEPAVRDAPPDPVKSPSPLLPTPMDGPPPQFPRTESTASAAGSRSKKRVIYKGKSCWISVPQELPRGTEGNSPMPLTPAEVTARLEQFEKAGFDTRGFGHWHDADPLLPPQNAQNRAVYPDPTEDIEARRRRQFRVMVPDRLKWKAYEDFLREEKLRALGVSPGGESDTTPMSRQSSATFSASLPFSPPLPTSSAGSNRHGHHSSVFQTGGFVPGSSNHTSTRSIASPISSLSNPRSHIHRQSMFSPSSLQHQGNQSPGLQSWSPQQFINQHGIPKGGSPAIPEYAGRQSPVSPFGQQQQFPFGQRDELLAQMQRQKQQQMQMHLLQQQQQLQQQMQQHAMAARPTSTLPELPEADEEDAIPEPKQSVRSTGPELVIPKPSHRHNISVKLERDIQNSDYHLEDSIDKQLDDDEAFDSDPKAQPQKQVSGGSMMQSRWAKGPQDDKVKVRLPERTTSLKKSISPEIVSTSGLRTGSAPEPKPDIAVDQQAAAKVPLPSDRDEDIVMSDDSPPAFLANPWANDPTFKSKDPSPPKQASMSNHTSKSSLSGLNVAAKAFNPSANPSATFNPGIFSSSAFSFQPAKAKQFIPGSSTFSGSQSSRHSANGSISGLSAAAPAFSPSGSFNFSPNVSTFSPKAPEFSPTSFGTLSGVPTENAEFNFLPKAPVFKPTAPEFKPSGSAVLASETEAMSTSEPSEKIFSNIDISESDIAKPARRSKAVPIVPPKAGSAEPEAEPEEKEDEWGRITQGDLRQKRARRTDSDGDQVPQFATPSDEPQAPVMEEDVNKSEALSKELTPEMEEVRKPSESVTPTPLAEGTAKVADAESADEGDLPTPGPNDSMLLEAVAGAELGASPLAPVSPISEPTDDEDHASAVESKLPESETADTSTLSAMATPFEFKPTFGIPSESRPRMANGRSSFEGEKESELVSAPASPSSSSNVFNGELDNSSDRIGEDLHSGITSPNSKSRLLSDVRYYDDLEQPSFQEIDAVMKAFDEGGSDAGVEREEASWPNSSPERGTSPPRPDFAAKIRSDAPSPSPRRYHHFTSRNIPETDTASITQDPFSDGRAVPTQDSPVHNLNENLDVPISDWDDVVSSGEDALLRERTSFFDTRVSDVIQSALEKRLAPMEKRLQHAIEAQLARMPSTSAGRRVRSRATLDSDADDEEDDAETDAYSRGLSPRKDRKMDKFRIMLQEALAASDHRSHSPSPMSKSGLGVVHKALEEIKTSVSQPVNTSPLLDQLREIVDESVSRQNQALVLSREQAIHAEDNDRFSEFTEKFKEAAARITEETQARKEAEKREHDTARLLKLAEEELSLMKDLERDTESKLKSLEDVHSHATDEEGTRAKLSKSLMAATAENDALKETLEEYRISSDKWRSDIDQANEEKERIRGSFGALRIQVEEALRIRETMRSRIEKLQTDMTAAVGQVAHERAKWVKSDTEHRTRYEILSARIEAEGRTRERLEQELERLEIQEREGMRMRVILEQTQKENARLQQERERLEILQRDAGTLKLELVQTQKENQRLEDLVNSLRHESEEHQKTADQYAREFREARDAGHMEVQRTRGLMEIDIEAANNQVNIVRADLESEISRVRAELESVKMDSDIASAKYELELEQEADAKRHALHDLANAKTVALTEQRETFEERMEELRKQHRRDLDHVIENKNHSETFLKETHAQRLKEMQEQYDRVVEQAIADKDHSEAHHNDLLTLADSKIDHLQDKVLLLEEKLEIAKSAAHAAALAAQSAKGPGQATSPVATFTQSSRLPEKISPQALRESIAVLQEQLQERESQIENLEDELSKVDQEAPSKIKARDTEIGWLRELLGVRVDDLADLVNALSQPNYNRDAVRNAAIRIRASLQMEQQEKERLLNGGPQNFPTLASISSFASPKAAQLAAAIGNWRKGSAGLAPSGLGQSVSSVAGSNTSSRTQTPSKSQKPPTAQNFVAGLMTPPASNVRRTPEAESASTIGGRTSLSRLINEDNHVPLGVSRSAGKQTARPVTPTLLRQGSYDTDADEGEGFSTAGFYDDEGSTVDGTPRANRMRSFQDMDDRLYSNPSSVVSVLMSDISTTVFPLSQLVVSFLLYTQKAYIFQVPRMLHSSHKNNNAHHTRTINTKTYQEFNVQSSIKMCTPMIYPTNPWFIPSPPPPRNPYKQVKSLTPLVSEIRNLACGIAGMMLSRQNECFIIVKSVKRHLKA
ncbi:hypothetical protein EJ08DRAFT_679139 [Tothia fuscella]|uniref:Fibronectin type-III domain-containing protein n=1 Tax=Tothia fuscella TaxID=1048955 RepID=A0A9P4NRY3_9PEZI|nr:hypothetical protein EJ08DRAFT_679139 [Tothia fuscella]